jgi:alkaline phosphatase
MTSNPSNPTSSQTRVSRRSIMKTGAAAGAGLALASHPVAGTFAQDATPTPAVGAAKNVIFMMGDGMGQAHRDFGQLVTVGAYDRLVMDTLPVLGLQGTNSVTADLDSLITDSAASATAFATGFKPLNGAVGVDPAGNTLTNLAELAKAAGKSVGLITTSQVTDASPAAFAAHVDDRDKQSEIAKQYITDAKVDVILGGGEDRWLPAGTAGAYPDNPPEDTRRRA